jgi:hypothetical protein
MCGGLVERSGSIRPAGLSAALLGYIYVTQPIAAGYGIIHNGA